MKKVMRSLLALFLSIIITISLMSDCFVSAAQEAAGNVTDENTFKDGYFDSTTLLERDEFQKAYLNGFVTEDLLKKDSVNSTLTEAEFYQLLLNAECVMGYSVGENAITFENGDKYNFKYVVSSADKEKELTRGEAADFFIFQFVINELGREYKIATHALVPRVSVWSGSMCTEMLETNNDKQRSISVFMLCNMDMVSGYNLMELDGEGYFRFNDMITVKEAVQLVFRYSRSNDEYQDNYVDMNSDTACEPLTLSEAELSFASNIPLMTYENMPEFNSMIYMNSTDYNSAMETDFEFMSELGINLIDYRFHYDELVSVDGKINTQSLQTLDKAVRYAAKYGMHIRVCLDEAGGEHDYHRNRFEYLRNGKTADGSTTRGFGTASFTAEKFREFDKSLYQTLAKRYRNVPINVMSFLLFDEPPIFDNDMVTTDNSFSEVCYVLADAVWEISPGRIIATDCLQAGEYPSYALAGEGVRRNNEAPKEYDQRIFQTMKFMGEWENGFYGEAPSTVNNDLNENYVIPSDMLWDTDATYTINANSSGFGAGTQLKVYVSGNADKLILTTYDGEGNKLEELEADCNLTNVYGTFTLGQSASKVVLSRTDKNNIIKFSYIWITYPEASESRIPISAFFKAEDSQNFQNSTSETYNYDEYNFDDINAVSVSDFANTFITRFTDKKLTFINCNDTQTAHGVNYGFKGDDYYTDYFFTTDSEITIKDGNDNRDYTASFKGDYDNNGEEETYSFTYAQFINQKMEKFKTFADKYNTMVLNREVANNYALAKEDYIKFHKDQFKALRDNKAGFGCMFSNGNIGNSGLFDGKLYGADPVKLGKYYIDKDMLSFYEGCMERFEIADINDQTYTGNSIAPELTVSYKGQALVRETDYDVVYADNIEPGLGRAMVVGKGEYSGIFSTAIFLISRLSENFIIEDGLWASVYTDANYTVLSEELGVFNSFEDVQNALDGKEGYLRVEINKAVPFKMVPYAEGIKAVNVVNNNSVYLNLNNDLTLYCDLILGGKIKASDDGITIHGNNNKLVLGSLEGNTILQGGNITADKLNIVIANSVNLSCEISDAASISLDEFEEGYSFDVNDEDPWSHLLYGYVTLIINGKVSAQTLYVYNSDIFMNTGSALSVDEISGKFGNIFLQNSNNKLPELTVSDTMKNMGWQIRCYLYDSLNTSNPSQTELVSVPTGTVIAYIPETADETVKDKLGVMFAKDNWDSYGLKTLMDNRLYYDDGTAEIEHLWDSEYTVDVPASCSKEGSKSIHCSVCDATKAETVIEATGIHSWNTEGSITKEATCKETGVKTYKCTGADCKATKEEDIPKLTTRTPVSAGNAVAATCLKAGKTSDTVCKVCGITLTTGSKTEPLGHSYDNGTVTKQATYKNTGIKTYRCKRSGCTATKTEIVAKLPQVSNKITVVAKHVITASANVQTIALKAKTIGGKLKYKSDNSKVKVSSQGKVTIPKNYSGKTVITITAGSDKYKTVTKKVAIIVSPAGVGIRTLTSPKKGQMKITWKKNPYVTGYVLQYSTDSKFAKTKTKTVTISSAKVVSKSISKLKTGKKYYVRVRTYKKQGNTSYYGKWSSVKSIKIKSK